MKRGFYTIMAAQFFSSLADNALFISAVALLRYLHEPDWKKAALVPIFAFFYVVLAPFVGALSDAFPKGKVMFFSNAVKAFGCILMLFGTHPLFAYAIVGLGAAAYSPAKYGILTELLPPSQLVKANGWIEGLTIISIILGAVVGGQLVNPHLFEHIMQFDIKYGFVGRHVTSPPKMAIMVIMGIYVLASVINTRIPRTDAPLQPMPKNIFSLLPEFWRCNQLLWKDKLGQISLAATTLFWGVSGNLRYLVLAWAAAALHYTEPKAAMLEGVVAIGTAAGAVMASRIKLDRAMRVMPLGILMGLSVLVLIYVDTLWAAVPFFVYLGALGGFLVVPMNAMLQHRGHSLMGAGRSIAVQNFNEQACILGLGFFYSFITRQGVTAFGAVGTFGVVVAGVMVLIVLWYRHNLKRHPEEIERLLEGARNDSLHGH